MCKSSFSLFSLRYQRIVVLWSLDFSSSSPSSPSSATDGRDGAAEVAAAGGGGGGGVAAAGWSSACQQVDAVFAVPSQLLKHLTFDLPNFVIDDQVWFVCLQSVRAEKHWSRLFFLPV